MSKDIDKKISLRKRLDEETKTGISDRTTEKLDELMHRAEPLLEQVNNLYNQYISGAAQVPPNDRRQQLDQIMVTLMLMAKPTATYRFRFNSLQAAYTLYRARWEKLMRDLEDGVIKRRTPGSRRGG